MLRYVETGVFAALGLACLRLWRRERGAADAWLATTFATLAAVFLIGLTLPQQLTHSLGPGDPEQWLLKLLVAALFAFPYLLFRFTAALEPTSAARRGVATVLTAAVVVWTALLPRIQASTDHSRPWWMLVLLGLLFLDWTVVAVMVGSQLWAAGRGRPNGVRRRMQLMAAGALFLVVALVPGLSPSNSNTGSVSHLTSQIIGLITAVLFFLGFAPPGVLRMVWRRREEAALQRAEMALMTVVSADEIARSILPPMAAIFGARRAALVTVEGETIGLHKIGPDELWPWIDGLASASRVSGPVRLLRGVIGLPLRHGWLIIETGVYTALFGQEEIDLLYTLGAFIDLALERADLFGRERDAREALERTHAELESLVYTFSHDLKSPLISLLGYMEYLRSDYGGSLDETANHFLDRMNASALYMSELIQDLLELSRIGRTETDEEDVPLAPLVEDIAEHMRTTFPGVTVVVGELPTVHVSALRARQLFTNLLENAARHGGRPDLQITLAADTDEEVAWVTVADDGRGIPAEYRERVFGIFERLEADHGAGGTGMGLAICRKIVDQLHGRIEIVDAPVGATFRIELPLAAVRPSQGRIPMEVT